MSARLLLGLVVGAALIAAAPPTRRDQDTDSAPPIGAAARARNGIEPLARPADDLGMAEDPPGSTQQPVSGPPPVSASPPSAATVGK